MSEKLYIRHMSGEEKHARRESREHRAACKNAEFYNNPDYDKYVEVHGKHFSRKLSEHVCSKMENRNGIEHTWTPEQVENAIMKMGKHLDAAHKYDAHYLANMAYADYYGSSLTSEPDCIQFAIDFIADPDGYAEKAFTHYISDAMTKCISIDWADFI